MNFELFNPTHMNYIYIFCAMWIIIPLVSKKKLDSNSIRLGTILLIIISIGLDIFDTIYRIADNNFSIIDDLPLHMCGLSLYLGSYTLYKQYQQGFELCYFWGIGGALQAILTPDTTDFTNNYYIFAFMLSHALIILNVLWMIIVLDMRFKKFALLRTIIITNLLLIPIAAVNILLDSNYFYLSQKPPADNPFLIGEWPIYLFYLEFFAIIILAILNIPMLLLNKLRKS